MMLPDCGKIGKTCLTLQPSACHGKGVSPIQMEIARTGGLYKRDYAKSHGVGLADAIVAATVLVENADFVTLNVKHYPMIADLKPAYRKQN